MWSKLKEIAAELMADTPEETVALLPTPPILLRIQTADTEQETHAHFLAYGWCNGYFSHLTEPVSAVLHEVTKGDKKWHTRELKAPLNNGLQVKACEIHRVMGHQFVGDTKLFLYMHNNHFTEESTASNPMLGGPTAEFLSVIHQIALKFECRITTIETSVEGNTLVIFTPWDVEYSLKTIKDHHNEQIVGGLEEH